MTEPPRTRSSPTLEEAMLRVEALERRCRRLRRAGLFALGLLVLFAVLSSLLHWRSREHVRADSIEVAGAGGGTRAFLDGDGTLVLSDDKGRGRLVLAAGRDGDPVVSLLGNDLKPLARLQLTRGEEPAFELRHASNGTAIVLGFEESGMPALRLLDHQGKPRAVLGLTADGSPRLELLDESGRAKEVGEGD